MIRYPLEDAVPHWPYVPEALRITEFLRFLHWRDCVARQREGDAIRNVWEVE